MNKWLFALIPLLVIGGLIGWRFQQRKTGTSAQSKMRSSRMNTPASVELAASQVRDIVNTFTATGSVESLQSVNISAKVSGRIAYLLAREGDHVRQGQVLVRLDLQDVQAQVRQQQAALAEAKFRLAQARLTQTTTTSSVVTQIRQQEAGVSSAEADITSTEADVASADADVASAAADVHQAEVTRTAQLEASKSAIEDAQSKIDGATAALNNTKANIKSVQANLDNATAKYERVTRLNKLGYVPAQNVEDAKTTVSVQQAAVEVANGQQQSAAATLNSVMAQKRSVEQQANVTRATADGNLEVTRARLTQAQAKLNQTRAKLAQSRARLAQAHAALEYARANAKQTPAYQQNLEALNAGVAMAQASLESARARLDDAELRSPLDGVVTARTQDVGGLASPGQSILTVQAMKKVWVAIAVPEDVSVKLRLNQPVTATFDALGGRTFPASIAQINPSADLQSRQYTIRVILDNPDNRFTAGMFARVSLVVDKASKVLAVPREAVDQDTDGSSYVIVAGKDNKAEQRPVVTGLSDAKWIAITAGLLPGEKVVTMSATTVRDGQQLNWGQRRPRGSGRGRRGQRSPAGDGAAPGAQSTPSGDKSAPRPGRAGRGAAGGWAPN